MNALRQALLILALAALPAAAVGLFLIDTKSEEAPAVLAPGEVELATVQAWPKVLWIDARAGKQFAQEHIPGALPLSEERWDDDLARLFDAWETDVPLVVYCDSSTCDTSHRVAARLRDEVGLENVHVLKGGWESWQKKAD